MIQMASWTLPNNNLLVEGFPRQRNQAHLLGWLYVFQRYSGKSIDMEYDFGL